VGGRRWKVNTLYSTIPHGRGDNENVLVLNKRSIILNEISRLGGEILARIEIIKQ